MWVQILICIDIICMFFMCVQISIQAWGKNEASFL